MTKRAGTLFHEILEILARHRPNYVIPRKCRKFWTSRLRTNMVHDKVQFGESRDYEVKGTEHITSGGQGLLSPHHLGLPHHRERFFCGSISPRRPDRPFPSKKSTAPLRPFQVIVQPSNELSERDREETRIADQHRRCIEHWNAFLERLPDEKVTLPSFPIWGDRDRRHLPV